METRFQLQRFSIDLCKEIIEIFQSNKKQTAESKVDEITDAETKALIEQYADELYGDEMNFDPSGIWKDTILGNIS